MKRITQGWRPISSAPKKAVEVLVLVPTREGLPRAYRMVAHWASDTSGDEQPPFQGWFYWTGHGFAQTPMEPTHWMPLPAPPKENSNG
jgi:hypothetical protein